MNVLSSEGVIEKYIFKAYNGDSPSTPLIRAYITASQFLAATF